MFDSCLGSTGVPRFAGPHEVQTERRAASLQMLPHLQLCEKLTNKDVSPDMRFQEMESEMDW